MSPNSTINHKTGFATFLINSETVYIASISTYDMFVIEEINVIIIIKLSGDHPGFPRLSGAISYKRELQKVY